MSIPTYTTGYPPDGSSLGETKSVIRNNLDGTFQTLAVDHVNNNGQPGGKPAGYHKVIHMVPQGSNPSPTAGYGQLFSKIVNTVTNDTALFWETGAGLVAQLTSNVNPSISTNGYTFLPGGALIQWGIKTSPGSGPTNIAFPLAFPNAVYSIQLTARNDGSHSAFTYYLDGAPTTTGFNYRGSTSGSNALYWIAIGS